MIVTVGYDERYPVYDAMAGEGNYYGDVCELTDAEWQDYVRVSEAWEAWQDKLATLKAVRNNVVPSLSLEDLMSSIAPTDYHVFHAVQHGILRTTQKEEE